MNFKKKFLFLGLFLALTLTLSACTGGGSEENEIGFNDETDAKAVMYFFWGDGCPHCATQKIYLDELKSRYSELEIRSYETWKNSSNADYFQEMAKAYGIKAQGVPATFIGDFTPFIGFNNEMKAEMERQVKFCLENTCPNPSSRVQ